MTDFSPITISSFKAYDIRGELGKNLDEDIATVSDVLSPNF